MKKLIKRNRGFSFVEVMMAISLFLIMMAGMMKESHYYAQTNSKMVIKSSASLAAQYILDDLRQDDVTAMPSATTPVETYNVTIDDIDFTINVTYCTQSTYCTTSARHLLAEVYHEGTKHFEMETVYTEI